MTYVLRINTVILDIWILRLKSSFVSQSAGVQFPQRPPATPSDNATQQHTNNLQNGVIRLSEQEDAASVEPQPLPESRYILFSSFCCTFQSC